MWESLNEDNKISLYVTQIEPGSDEVKQSSLIRTNRRGIYDKRNRIKVRL